MSLCSVFVITRRGYSLITDFRTLCAHYNNVDLVSRSEDASCTIIRNSMHTGYSTVAYLHLILALCSHNNNNDSF